jgi:uncharacterized membrane protein
MNSIKFPEPYHHEHPPVTDLNELVEKSRTVGQKAADKIANIMGSWKFLIIQSILLGAWIILNFIGYINHWDPYPFILLNLFLSMQAAYTAPVIMMSQNRQAERDRLDAHNDFLINKKAEVEVRLILEHLEVQNKVLEELLKAQNEMKESLLKK